MAISRKELKRLQKLGSSRAPLKVGQNFVFEAQVVGRKGKRETVGQPAPSAEEAKKKLESGGARVLKVKKLKPTLGKGLLFVAKHRIHNGVPYRA